MSLFYVLWMVRIQASYIHNAVAKASSVRVQTFCAEAWPTKPNVWEVFDAVTESLGFDLAASSESNTQASPAYGTDPPHRIHPPGGTIDPFSRACWFRGCGESAKPW
jgi:hypothetical protein